MSWSWFGQDLGVPGATAGTPVWVCVREFAWRVPSLLYKDRRRTYLLTSHSLRGKMPSSKFRVCLAKYPHFSPPLLGSQTAWSGLGLINNLGKISFILSTPRLGNILFSYSLFFEFAFQLYFLYSWFSLTNIDGMKTKKKKAEARAPLTNHHSNLKIITTLLLCPFSCIQCSLNFQVAVTDKHIPHLAKYSSGELFWALTNLKYY